MNLANGETFDCDSRLSELRLLQLSDSALPIGSLAHSFGLETLVDCGLFDAADLGEFFRAYLEEGGTLEAVFCRNAYLLGRHSGAKFPAAEWVALNRRLTARKPAREAREASITLGQNFLARVLALEDVGPVRSAFDASKAVSSSAEIHHSTAFGLVCGALGFGASKSAAAFLHQQLASLVSACQRLLPLGQTAAARLQWNLKPSILHAAERSAELTVDAAAGFTPLLDWGAMEHPALSTRLFVS
jgi:urease accessory protein